jgi:2-keto-4-pentenoate hydratase/2-oxohepta-3-ene-1,7-dioic acid hydratase in catechol pathway
MKIELPDADYTVTRVFCIGRNYEAHVREMKSDAPGAPGAPVIFSKPPSSLVKPGEKIRFPAHGEVLHHEVELVLLVGRAGRARTEAEARDFIAGITVGLDLTLRDVQQGLKKRGHPWEIAKAFDQSAPVGDFIPCDEHVDLGGLSFSCRVNGALRQQGHSKDMILSMETLVMVVSRIWALRPGDLVFTGTPSGVGLLHPGDRIQVENEQIGSYTWDIIEAVKGAQ